MKNTHTQSTILGNVLSHQEEKDQLYPITILCSPSDVGVIKNKGRSGAKWAPKAIINQLAKFNSHLTLSADKKILISNITDQYSEEKDYKKARSNAADKALRLISKSECCLHLGGGHDQIYPLLMAIDKSNKFDNIIILNIDAHCDTRIDKDPNSGTPFRDFDRDGVKPFHLIQYGLQSFSNSSSTLSALQRGSEKKIFIEEIKEITEEFKKPPQIDFNQCPFVISDRTAFVFSLDSDAIDSSDMKAVSAVNPEGVPFTHVLQIQKKLSLLQRKNCFYGIYEFNPAYMDSSLSCLKKISSLVYKILESEINDKKNK